MLKLTATATATTTTMATVLLMREQLRAIIAPFLFRFANITQISHLNLEKWNESLN